VRRFRGRRTTLSGSIYPTLPRLAGKTPVLKQQLAGWGEIWESCQYSLESPTRTWRCPAIRLPAAKYFCPSTEALTVESERSGSKKTNILRNFVSASWCAMNQLCSAQSVRRYRILARSETGVISGVNLPDGTVNLTSLATGSGFRQPKVYSKGFG